MKYLKKYILFEKSIGSENIRTKYYSDIPKRTFYKITKIDPTSVRKENFSKPGKYSKWLIKQYKRNLLNLDDEFYTQMLNYYLFIFSTSWFNKKYKGENDIYKYTLSQFMLKMMKLKDMYESETKDSKFDLVYSDDNIDVLIPLNFSASYEISKNTDWCTQSKCGFDMWNNASILFRIVPKNNRDERLKLTWNKKYPYTWYIASIKYPEIRGRISPFLSKNGKEMWQYRLEDFNEKYKEQKTIIYKTMKLLSEDAKNYIINKHTLLKSK